MLIDIFIPYDTRNIFYIIDWCSRSEYSNSPKGAKTYECSGQRAAPRGSAGGGGRRRGALLQCSYRDALAGSDGGWLVYDYVVFSCIDTWISSLEVTVVMGRGAWQMCGVMGPT